MTSIRARVRAGARAELHSIKGRELLLGSGPCAGLQIDHPSVVAEHARLIVRRGELILVDLCTAPKGTRFHGARINAPIALPEGAPFELGEVQLSAWLEEEDPWVGLTLDGYQIEQELDLPDPAFRRYLARRQDGVAEILVAGPESACVPRSPGGPLQAGLRGSRHFWVEAVPDGIRLQALSAAVHSARLRVPIEAWVVIVAQIAERLLSAHRRAPHGAIEPRCVQLGLDGSVEILSAGSLTPFDRLRRAHRAPELGAADPPTMAGDAYGLWKIARTLLGNDGEAAYLIEGLRAPDPARREVALEGIGQALLGWASANALDPSTAHVCRLVRLLTPDRDRPLARVVPTPLDKLARSASLDLAQLDRELG